MEADINLLSDECFERGCQTVNQYYIKDHFQGEAREKLQQIYDIMREGNRIISEDADYGSIPSFYTNISIGKWDKRFMVVKKEKKEAVKQQPREQIQVEPIVEGKVSIIDYSEKAIAVVGDTKPIKETLKEMGGRFNFHLRCGAGWIFPKTKQEELKNKLGLV
jgi:hypothetical protein